LRRTPGDQCLDDDVGSVGIVVKARRRLWRDISGDFRWGGGKPRAAAKGGAGGGQLEELSASKAAAGVVGHSLFPALVAVVGR
jgi:hypothetical protein